MCHKKYISVLVAFLFCLFCSCSHSSYSKTDNSDTISHPEPTTAEQQTSETFNIRERIENNINDSSDKLLQDTSFPIDENTVGSEITSLYSFINKTGDYPVYKCSDIEYYDMGEKALPHILEELEKAEDFILIEYYIISEGTLWDSIYDILKRKAASGVEVKIMYDGLRDGTFMPYDFPERLKQDGIECHVFSSVLSGGAGETNIRDHRKILVIDNKTAFSGGMNLADEYINISSPYGKWKDNCFKITGQAVSSYTLMFLQLWNSYESEKEYDRYLTSSQSTTADNGFIMPFSDNPFDEYAVSKSVYMSILENSKEHVYITTPYLMPDTEFETLLCETAKRGVDVRIIVPGIYDGYTAAMLSRSHYRRLINSGVKVYEYTPGFIHCKIFESDDIKAVLGTINLDNRSLVYHFECGSFIYNNSVINDVKADYLKTLEECEEITTDNISLLNEIGGGLIKGFEGFL